MDDNNNYNKNMLLLWDGGGQLVDVDAVEVLGNDSSNKGRASKFGFEVEVELGSISQSIVSVGTASLVFKDGESHSVASADKIHSI